MMLTRLAVGLEPLNALDAAHRSPRSAPLSRAQNLVPPLGRLLADPLSETKNWRNIRLSRFTVKLERWPRKNLPVNERAMEILRQ
jgi:hypothetical protein